MNRNVKILGRRFYSPSLKDVAWLEHAQLIFLIFNTFVCKFGWVDKRLDAVRGKKIYKQMYRKLKKIVQWLIGKLHPSNLVNTIFYLVVKRFDSQIVKNLILEEVICDWIPIQTL